MQTVVAEGQKEECMHEKGRKHTALKRKKKWLRVLFGQSLGNSHCHQFYSQSILTAAYIFLINQ